MTKTVMIKGLIVDIVFLMMTFLAMWRFCLFAEHVSKNARHCGETAQRSTVVLRAWDRVQDHLFFPQK